MNYINIDLYNKLCMKITLFQSTANIFNLNHKCKFSALSHTHYTCVFLNLYRMYRTTSSWRSRSSGSNSIPPCDVTGLALASACLQLYCTQCTVCTAWTLSWRQRVCSNSSTVESVWYVLYSMNHREPSDVRGLAATSAAVDSNRSICHRCRRTGTSPCMTSPARPAPKGTSPDMTSPARPAPTGTSQRPPGRRGQRRSPTRSCWSWCH